MIHSLFEVTQIDIDFYNGFIKERLPEHILDSHVHLALPEHTRNIEAKLLKDDWALQCANNMTEELLNKYSSSLFPNTKFMYIALPMPIKGVNLEANNKYNASIRTRRLMGTLPEWDKEYCEEILLEGGFSGFKPYPNLVSTTKGADISILDFIPHHQLALLNKHKKAVLIHLPRAGRLPDEDNIKELKLIRNKYPDLKIVIAHFGRCFNLEPFLQGIKKLGNDLEGFYFDTAAVLNPQVYAAAFDSIRPDRILFGTDMPVMLWHGKRTWNNGTYQNLCRENFPWNTHSEGEEAERHYTFFIYEQIKNTLDAIGNDNKLKRQVFYENAEKVYTPCVQ
jgi:hypothetical protein